MPLNAPSRDPPRADAGAGDDPLVAGVDALGELVGQHVLRDGCDERRADPRLVGVVSTKEGVHGVGRQVQVLPRGAQAAQCFFARTSAKAPPAARMTTVNATASAGSSSRSAAISAGPG